MTKKIIVDGNIFGNKNNDEFSIDIADDQNGVFKRFEYLSLPFSITNNWELFEQLLEESKINGNSFEEAINENMVAHNLVTQILDNMRASESFSKQTLDMLLSGIYVKDNFIDEIKTHDLNSHLAKIISSWEFLADFYSIEGLVGGGGGDLNPFNDETNYSMISGVLDSLEGSLSGLKADITKKEWNKILLKLSSIVGRSYSQIEHAVDVQKKVFGDKKLSASDISDIKKSIDDLTKIKLETNKDFGKFYNALIRFHGWMPSNLSKCGEGNTYDSICSPVQKAMESLEDHIIKELNIIKDATSPKGLAMVLMADMGIIGNKKEIGLQYEKIKDKIKQNLRKDSFDVLDLDDPSFYTGLTGGKWRGLKLLYDSAEGLDLNYSVPSAKIITNRGINKLLDQTNIKKLLKSNLFELDDITRKNILDEIDEINFPEYLLKLRGDDLVIRSSMYGEDGESNFSGVYESFHCNSEEFETGIRDVIKSYFSENAVKSREDLGLAHIPGINVIIQEKKEGLGGIIHLAENEYSLSFAKNAEDAVAGNGTHKHSKCLNDLIKQTALEPIYEDLVELHDLFGDADLEFVINEGGVYLIQHRPKLKLAKKEELDLNKPRVYLNNWEELANTYLNQEVIVRINFFNDENIMDKKDELLDFIRQNKKYIIAIEGSMPSVAHIPNNIEGHFKIPYIKIEGDEYVN